MSKKQNKNGDNSPKKNSFNVPETFWKQLTEFSNGGAVCFYLNENNDLQIFQQFDNEMVQTFFETKIADWANVNQAISSQSTQQAIIEGMFPEQNTPENPEDPEVAE